MQRQSSAHSICGRALGRLGLRSLGTSGSAEGSRLCRSPRRFCCMSLTSWDRPRKIFALFWMVPTEETKVPRAPVGASVCWLQMPTMKSWSACPQTQQQHHAEHRRARSKLHSWAGFRRGLWLAWYMASAAGLSTSCSSAALPYPTACCCRYFAFVFLRAFSGRRQKRVLERLRAEQMLERRTARSSCAPPPAARACGSPSDARPAGTSGTAPVCASTSSHAAPDKKRRVGCARCGCRQLTKALVMRAISLSVFCCPSGELFARFMSIALS